LMVYSSVTLMILQHAFSFLRYHKSKAFNFNSCIKIKNKPLKIE